MRRNRRLRVGPRSGEARSRGQIHIYGRNPVGEAVKNVPQALRKVWLAGEAGLKDLKAELTEIGITVEVADSKTLGKLVGEEAIHQGVVAAVDLSAVVREDAGEFIDNLAIDAETMLVVLDELMDPQNVGAVIRSAAAFGASGVLLPRHRQASVTGSVIKASAGMAFTVPLVYIGNVNQTIDKLQRLGFKAYALDAEGKMNLNQEVFSEPSVFVVGSEGTGIRQKTLERCDVSLKIKTSPRCESLNASAAAAVVFYEWSKQQNKNW
ncbi:MAG: 23S rRNA (guanosine(2251)-2'-O)-methyltransferase RlmB [Patescibacteria group bacterium]|nr:23S rRNA (guanosine(2251)-2'-O)-methyltransferase RlmB [Patescibacteria group bacterium]